MPHVLDLKIEKKQIAESQTAVKTINWTAKEFTEKEKSLNWFLGLSITSFLFLAAALWIKNYTLAIVVLLSFLCLYLSAKKKPKEINFSISGQGVAINKTIYPHHDLKSFWIFYDPPRIKELSLRSKKKLMPYLRLPLAGQNPNEIRAFLIKYLAEAEQEESLIDILIDKFNL